MGEKKFSNKKVIVVGAGLGGISAAITLATQGFQVDVFEKNEKLGGKLNVLKEKGFSFDLGPSIFTLPQFFEPLFKNAGKNMADYFTLKRVDPQWRNFFEDGTILDLWEDSEKMKHELAKLGPDLWEPYQKFLSYCRTQYEITDRGYFQEGLDTFTDFMKFYGLFGAAKLDWHSTMAGGIGRHFKNRYLRDTFEYFIKYVGASAYRAPGFMNLMPIIQLDYGLWYVEGGLYNLALGLQKLAGEVGVRFHFNSEIEHIEHGAREVSGVRVRGEKELHKADFIVSNMEVIPAYKDLLKEDESFMESLEKFEPACSGIVIHLGVNRVYPQLAHHNFFYSDHQKEHFHRVFVEKKLPNDPTIYLVAPSRSDASVCPPGHDNIKILPHIPYIDDKKPVSREEYVQLKNLCLEKLERMGLTDLRKHIVVEDFWTPLDIQARYKSNKGSIYGVVSDLWRNYAFKAPKASTKYKNLFFVGGSVNPGGGMPMVVLSGQKAAQKLMEQASR